MALLLDSRKQSASKRFVFSCLQNGEGMGVPDLHQDVRTGFLFFLSVMNGV